MNRHDLDKMKDFVAAAAERGMVVMLDLHNYCRRYMNGEHTIIGTNGLTPEHLASFWKSLATEFKSFDNIYAYGLMNEPHDLDSCTTWFEMAQLTPFVRSIWILALWWGVTVGVLPSVGWSTAIR